MKVCLFLLVMIIIVTLANYSILLKDSSLFFCYGECDLDYYLTEGFTLFLYFAIIVSLTFSAIALFHVRCKYCWSVHVFTLANIYLYYGVNGHLQL